MPLSDYGDQDYAKPGPDDEVAGPDGSLPLPVRLVPGDEFVLRAPDSPEAVWGAGQDVAWSAGEALMIVADSGLGKTTLAGLLTRALLGIDSEVLGLPVKPAQKRVLYLAMDRPRQTQRALRRQFLPKHQRVLRDRLVCRPGPPPADMALDTTVLARLAREAGASHVVVDSLKDAALRLSEDGVGAGYNRARQTAITEGVEVLELHHNRKQQQGTARAITSLSDVYGSTWLTSGAGSVLALNGEVGGSVLELRHLKQPASDIGSLRITVDRSSGEMTTAAAADVLDCLSDAWLTPTEVAVLFARVLKPERAVVETVRRRLDRLVADGLAERGAPAMTGNGRTGVRYRRTGLHAILHDAARDTLEQVR